MDEKSQEQKVTVVFRDLLRWKWAIFVFTVIFFLASVLYSLLAPEYFRSENVFRIYSDNHSGTANSLVTQLGGLAGIPGLGSVGSSGQVELFEYLNSRRFQYEFITENGLKTRIFEECWSSDALKWQKPCSEDGPSLHAAHRSLQKIMKVIVDKKRQIHKVVVVHEDPAFAASLANSYVQFANQNIKKIKQDQANSKISYINQQLLKSDKSEVSRIFYSLLESEVKTLSLVNGQDFYQVIDPAVPAEIRFKPNRKMIVLISTFAGLMLSIFVVLIISSYKNGAR